MRLVAVVEEYLLAWVVLAVGVGLVVPRLAVVTRASTLILAVMIGSVSLTLSVEAFREVRPATLGRIVAGHVGMPFLAFGIARALGLSGPLVVGFVVLGAVTPELVTPTVTTIADGDTALATTALVVVGLGSVVFVPWVVTTLAGDVRVPTRPIVAQLATAVVAPMVVAVGLRAWQPTRVGRYDDYYPAVSAVMVVTIIGGVTAANAGVVRVNLGRVGVVTLAAVLLNLGGYAVGALVSRATDREERIAATLSVGMRDFAVAAALVVAAGLPTVASLPAVAFGVVEMTTSAAIARWVRE